MKHEWVKIKAHDLYFFIYILIIFMNGSRPLLLTYFHTWLRTRGREFWISLCDLGKLLLGKALAGKMTASLCTKLKGNRVRAQSCACWCVEKLWKQEKLRYLVFCSLGEWDWVAFSVFCNLFNLFKCSCVGCLEKPSVQVLGFLEEWGSSDSLSFFLFKNIRVVCVNILKLECNYCYSLIY